MEKLLEITLLYDFYGELLTNKQKKVCELYFLNDLSLGEISEMLSISRQAVYDNVKRSQKQLYYYETKLQLVKRFMSQKEDIKHIRHIVDDIEKSFNSMQIKDVKMQNKLELLKKSTENILKNY